MYFDVGVYGVSRKALRNEGFFAPSQIHEMESWLIQNDGYSALYAIVELSREEFEQMFDRKLYREMREKWKANGVLMDCYDKVKKKK